MKVLLLIVLGVLASQGRSSESSPSAIPTCFYSQDSETLDKDPDCIDAASLTGRLPIDNQEGCDRVSEEFFIGQKFNFNSEVGACFIDNEEWISGHSRSLQSYDKDKFCSAYKSCFECASTKRFCQWEQDSCRDRPNKDELLGQNWFEYFEECPGTSAACEESFDKNYDSTHFYMNPIGGRLSDNTYCKYEYNMTGVKSYGVEIYRRNRYKFEETIALFFNISSPKGNQESTLSDESIRSVSIVNRMTSDARSRYVFTSYSNESHAHLTFYAKSNWITDSRTFRISIYPDYTFSPGLSQTSLTYSLMNFVFFVICISCVFRLCKVIFLKCRNIRINVVEDSDTAAAANRERTQQQELNLIFSRVHILDVSAQREEREKARKEKHMKEAKTLMELMERPTFHQDQGEFFDMKDCVICSDEFVQGEELARVPICHHVFHPACIQKWLESKSSEAQKRCPMCNQELLVEEMRNN